MPSIKASKGLTSILNQQRNPKLKDGLGYEEGSSSDHPSNTKPIKFVKSSNIDNNHSAETKKENHVMIGRRIQVKHNNSYEHKNRYDLLFIEL
jgi:hypothetical protein